MYSDLQYLSIPLPEDIQKLKWYGDYERLRRVIAMRLEQQLPESLRKRLELELELSMRTEREYPYTQAEALAHVQQSIPGFAESELEQLRDENAVEWAYINGVLHYKDNFFDNLLATRAEFKKRAELKSPHIGENDRRTAALRDEVIAHMKQTGKMGVRMRIRSELRVLPEFERDGEKILVHLPLPVDYAQVKNIKVIAAAPEPELIADERYPQRTVSFRCAYKPGMHFSVEYEYETHMKYVDPKPECVLDAQPTFYTEEQLPHIQFTPYIKWLTAEIIGSETNPLEKARSIYNFITTQVKYSYMRSYLTMPNIVEYVATGLKGDCGVQALLFITLCRCCGVPARWQAGLSVNPITGPGCHDWAQFYVAPYGWLFADPSFGGGAYRSGALERQAFYFGNLDPFRLPANSDFQHEFNPPKKYLRWDPYDNQSGEAEYESGMLQGWQFDTEHTLLAWEKLY